MRTAAHSCEFIPAGTIRRIALALVGVAALSAGLAGCGTGSEALPSNLPPSGGGIFFISTAQVEDGVINRGYSKVLSTTGGTPPLASCTFSAGTPPPGLNVVALPNSTQCQLSGVPTMAGSFSFTVQAQDSIGTTASQSYTMAIRNEFSITGMAPDPLPDGVEDAAYNFVFTVTTNTVSGPDDFNEVAENGNGPITLCTLGGLPAGMMAVGGTFTGNSCQMTLSGAPNLGLGPMSAPVTVQLTLSVTDSPIAAASVPARTITQTAIDLTIQPPVSFTLTTGGTFVDATSGGNAPVAVNGRTYGAPNRMDLVFTASGGIAPYTWSNLSGAADPDPFQCTQMGAQFLCNSNNMPITTAGGTATTLTVQVQDAGNAATAASTQGTDISGHASHGIFVNGALMVASDLGDPLPDAVMGQPYGEAAGTPATFTATGGTCDPTLNGSCSFMTAPSVNMPGAAFPTTIACATGAAPNANRFSCATTMSTITAATGTYMPTVNATDVANDTTPAAAGTMVTVSVDVVAGMMFTLTTDPNVTFVDNTGSAPDAVNGRTYGGPAKSDLLFEVTGGRPPYTWSDNSVTPLSPLACVQETLVNTNDRFRCNTDVSAVTNLGATMADLTVSVMDTGSATVPAATATMDDQGHASHAISVRDPLVITMSPQAAPNQAPDGVTGRPYGMAGGGASDLLFTISGTAGIGMTRTWDPDEATVAGSSNTQGFPDDLDCTETLETELTCTTGMSTLMVGGNVGFTVAVTDEQNDTTPAATPASDPGSIFGGSMNIQGEIVIDNMFLPNGVVGQPYSATLTCNGGGAICGGTGNPRNVEAMYTWGETNNPGNCQPSVPDNPDITVSTSVATNPSTGLYSGTPTNTGTFMPIICVTDDGNATTPSCDVAGTCPVFTPTYDVLDAMLLVDSNNGAVDVFSTQTGTAMALSNFSVGGTPRRVAITPNGTIGVVVEPNMSTVTLKFLPAGAAVGVTTTQMNGPLTSGAGDPVSVAIGPAARPMTNPDSYVAYVANPTAGTVDIIDIDPNSMTFGQVIASPAIAGAFDVAVTPSIDPGTGPQTRAYVLSGTDDVCVIDAEPSSGGFGTQIDLTGAIGTPCIDSTGLGDSVAIEITPDGLFAIVAKSDGAGDPAGVAGVDQIDVDPTSLTRDTITSGGNIAAEGCRLPSDLRSLPNGIQAWVTCRADTTTGNLVVRLFPSPAAQGGLGVGVGGITLGDDPVDIAFTPDTVRAFVTKNTTDEIVPITVAGTVVGTDVALPNATGPEGIDHIGNPPLHVATTGTLPTCGVGLGCSVSIVVQGGVAPYTWADPSGTAFDMNGVGQGGCSGLTLNTRTGLIAGTATQSGGCTFTLVITDSTPGSPQTTSTTNTIPIT